MDFEITEIEGLSGEIAKEINKRINNREIRIEDDGQVTEL